MEVKGAALLSDGTGFEYLDWDFNGAKWLHIQGSEIDHMFLAFPLFLLIFHRESIIATVGMDY